MIEKDKAKKGIVRLLKSYMEQQPACVDLETDDWKRVIHYADIHAIGGIIASAVKMLPEDQQPEEELKKYLRNELALTVSGSVSQELAMDDVTAVLNERGIKHVLIKGFVLRDIYPIRELRSMGDIDFLIDRKQRQACHQAMLDIGFACTLDRGFVWCYQRANVILEIHTNLMAGDPVNDVDFEQYYENIWDRTEVISGCTCRLRTEDHLIYLIAHAAKHFRSAGYGIRGVMDCAVVIRHFGEALDWERVWSQLELLKLDRFAAALFLLCEQWFGTALPGRNRGTHITEESFRLFVDIIFEGGVYGYFGRNLEQIQIRNQMTEGVENNPAIAKMKTGFKALFPGMRYMRMYMSSLEKYPFLLPAAWVVRWYQAVFKRGHRNLERVKNFTAPDEGMAEEYKMMKNLGLL